MGTPTKKPRPFQGGALKASHLRMLSLAKSGPVLTRDKFDSNYLVPLPSLPIKGAVATTVIASLQKRGLLDAHGSLTPTGTLTLQSLAEASVGEC